MNSSNPDSLAILGRGIAGLTAAYYLVKAGIRPVIYGRREGAAQASRAAQGVLCNKGLIFSESPLFRAKLESLAAMQAFLDQLERDVQRPLPRHFTGVYEPVWDRADFQATVSRIYRHKFWGAHGTEFQEGGKAHPEALKSPLGYLHYPSDGWFDPRAVLDALEDYLRLQGVVFRDQEVSRLSLEGSRVCLDGEESFDSLALANGAGAFNLWPDLDCKPLRMFLIGGQTLECRGLSEAPPRIEVKGNQSLARLSDRAIFGSTSWQGFASEDMEADEAALRSAVETNFGLRFGEGLSRSGTRMRFRDRMPLVGWLNTGKFAGKIYFMTGFYKNGMHLAEICAREMFFDITKMSEKRRYPEFSAHRFSV